MGLNSLFFLVKQLIDGSTKKVVRVLTISLIDKLQLNIWRNKSEFKRSREKIKSISYES